MKMKTINIENENNKLEINRIGHKVPKFFDELIIDKKKNLKI